MRAASRWALRVFLIVVAGLILLAVITARPGDASLHPPKDGARRIVLHVVSHGYHAGLILPRAEIDRVARADDLTGLASLAALFGAYEYVEVGWGDEDFYRNVPELSWTTLPHALRALFGFNNASVLHVVGFDGAPERVFRGARMIVVEIGEEGLRRLLDRMDSSIGRDPAGEAVILGAGLYGPSVFARAQGGFHIASVCNHWVGWLVNAAGLPVAPVLATHPAGLFADLIWRGGAREAGG